jgi:glucosyl-3-phosphoglycerate synthase
MSFFAQKHTKITTFSLLAPQQAEMVDKLLFHSKWKKAVLVVPLLATEFTEKENRPVFDNIVEQLAAVAYLSHIIFGLDGASDEEALKLADILRSKGLNNFLIQHNDGAGFASIYKKLSEAGFRLDQPGKGRNMFLSFGIALALGAQSIGVIDADIRTFDRRMIDRLFFPVVVLNYQFSKAFYARLKNDQLYGRAKRLLLDPLLIALKRKFTDTQEDKVLRIVDFLLSFHYQLSGEVAFENSLLRRMHFATNWGVEIFTLIEVYRKANAIAQVEVLDGAYDHKHQPISEEDGSRGIHKMGVDIVTTLLSALVVEEGLEISDHFIRDLTITYLDVADQLIKMYADNAAFSGLRYDRNEEETAVRSVFKDAILFAGDLLITPYRLSDRFLSFVSTNEEFKPFMENGLARAIDQVGIKQRDQLYETPQTVSWDRVNMRLPEIMYEIVDVIEAEKKRFRQG